MTLVTVALPIYKRLKYLPQVLSFVESQDYSQIELIVSDNGSNGSVVRDIVQACYSRPYRFRQNPSTVSISTHWNQIIDEAAGDYFLVLCDDDEITPNFVSCLVDALERHSEASVAISAQHSIDESGTTIGVSRTLPTVISGPEFIRAAWDTYEYELTSFTTVLYKTEALRACGGYPEIWRGHSNDDLLMVKLCLNSNVAFAPGCTFRKRVYEDSHGLSIAIEDIVKATRQTFEFLDFDPILRRFGAQSPSEWKELKTIVGRMNWETYFNRWKSIYRRRLTPSEWVRAAFTLPFIPAYYAQVARTLLQASAEKLLTTVRKRSSLRAA